MVASVPDTPRPAYPALVQSDHPTAVWPLSEQNTSTAADSSGNDLAAAYVNGPTLDGVGAIVGVTRYRIPRKQRQAGEAVRSRLSECCAPAGMSFFVDWWWCRSSTVPARSSNSTGGAAPGQQRGLLDRHIKALNHRLVPPPRQFPGGVRVRAAYQLHHTPLSPGGPSITPGM